MAKLRRLKATELPADCFEPVDPKALEQAKTIVNDISAGGEPVFIKYATKFGDIKEGESYIATKEELKAAFDGLSEENRGILTRVVSALLCFACHTFTLLVHLLSCARYKAHWTTPKVDSEKIIIRHKMLSYL